MKLQVGSTDDNCPLDEAFRAGAPYQHKMLHISSKVPISGRQTRGSGNLIMNKHMLGPSPNIIQSQNNFQRSQSIGSKVSEWIKQISIQRHKGVSNSFGYTWSPIEDRKRASVTTGQIHSTHISVPRNSLLSTSRSKSAGHSWTLSVEQASSAEGLSTWRYIPDLNLRKQPRQPQISHNKPASTTNPNAEP